MKKSQPPRLAAWIFDWFSGQAHVDDLHGDMEEIFHRNVSKFGVRRARWIYHRQVFSLICSYAIRKRRNQKKHHPFASSNMLSMLPNYLKVGFRSLMRHRYFAIINMVGLAIGMSVSLLILSIFMSVTDYDEFHANKDRIFRIITTTNQGEELASAPAILAEKIRSEFVGAKHVVRIDRSLFTDEPQPRQEAYLNGYYVDEAFLDVFTFPLVQGDPNTALSDPTSVVLTEHSAERIFGSADPIGRQINVGGRMMQVSGIMKDYPANTHLAFDALASIEAVAAKFENLSATDSWTTFRRHFVYVELEDGIDPARLQEYVDRVASSAYTNQEDFRASFKVQALGAITPGPELNDSIGPTWSYQSFAIAGGLALLILLPACFNYANISIARSLKRSKEIGLRKTLGSRRHQILLQFLSETMIIAAMSLVGAAAIFFLIRHEFQSMLVHASALDLSLTPGRVAVFILFGAFTAVTAGLVPGLHFARLSPMEAMRTHSATNPFSGMRLRKALMVFQFALCLTFILGLVVFSKQYRYARGFDLGFNQENILDVSLSGVEPAKVEREFSKLADVHQVSFSSGVMGHGVPSTWASLDGSTDSTQVFQMYVDGHFVENMGLKLLAGNSFEEFTGRETSVIINETLMKRLSYAGPSEALNQVLRVDTLSLRIIGVVKDFHFWQLHAPPGNFFFRSNPEEYRLANVQLVSSDVQRSIERLEASWRNFSQGILFKAEFLSEETAGAFSNYITLLKIFGFLGLLAVTISCLGLLGMVVYATESKTKEVGIRKVMGATQWSLVYLLARDFLKLMFIACIFALPITLLLNKVLSGLDYYRVPITIFDVLLGVLGMLFIGILTMASQTWRTAGTNPAETLKVE